MANNNISRFHEIVVQAGLSFDDVDTKRLESIAKTAGDLMSKGLVKEAGVAFEEISKMFNKKLVEMGKGEIDFSDMIKMPDATTLEKMTSGFTQAIATNVADGIINGINDGVANASKIAADALKKQLGDLETQRKALEKERAQIELSIKNRAKMKDLSNFSVYTTTPLKMDGDLIESANKLLDEFQSLAHKIDKTKRPDSYASDVIAAQEKLNDLYRAQLTLKQNIINLPRQVKEDFGLIENENGEWDNSFEMSEIVEDVQEAFEELEDVFVEAEDSLRTINKELQKIDVKINNIRREIDGAVSNVAQNGLKEVEEIEKAYDRIVKKKNKQDDISKAVNYIPGSESLTVLKNSYNKSVANEEGWEEQYKWLIKFVKEYEAYEVRANSETGDKRKNMLKTLKGYTKLYNQIKPLADSAEVSLQNVLNMVDKVPLVGVGGEDKNISVTVSPNVEDPINITKEVTGGKEEIVIPVKPVVEDGSVGSILNNPMFANMFKKPPKDDGVKHTNNALATQVDTLTDISKLTNYIDTKYLSTGKHLSDFLDELQRDGSSLSEELKEILTSLKLIDDQGNLTFNIKRNGEAGGGTTHNGALISDEFVLIERGKYEKVKNSKLPKASQSAKKDGFNVAEVLGYLPSKYTGGFFDVQRKAIGHNLFQDGMLSPEVINATEEQLQQLVQAFIHARDYGFNIENGGSNIVYDKDKGFSFYDLEELSSKDTEFWNAKSEQEKKLYALEEFFSLFTDLNRDFTKYESDPNVNGFAEKLKKLIIDKGIVDPNAQLDGRNYEDIFNDVFDGGSSIDNLDSFFERIKQEATTHRENTEAIKQETQAQEELNNAKINESQIGDNEVTDVQFEVERQKTIELEKQAELERQEKARLEEENRLKAEALEKERLAREEAQKQAQLELAEKQRLEEENRLKAELLAKQQEELRMAQEQALAKAGAVSGQGVAGGDTSAEVDSLDAIRTKITDITTAVGTKTTAFTNEAREVQRVAGAEIESLTPLEQKINAITSAVKEKTQEFFNEQSAVKRIAQSEVQALDGVEKKITAIRVALKNLKATQPKITVSISGAEDTDSTVLEEMNVLKKLRASINLTTEAVNEKTMAFDMEGSTVGKVIGKEISGLMKLEKQIGTVNNTILDLLANIKTAQGAGIDVHGTTKISDGRGSKKRGAKKDTADAEYQKYLKEEQKDIDALAVQYGKLGRLREEVNNTPPGKYLDVLQDELSVLEAQIKAEYERLALSSDDAKRMDDAHNQAYYDASAERAKKTAKDATEAEKKIRAAAIKDELEEQEAVYAEAQKKKTKAQEKSAKDALKLAKKEALVGKAGNAVSRAENTWLGMTGADVTLSNDLQGKLNDYYEKLDNLRKLQHKVNTSETVSSDDKEKIQKQTIAVNKLTKEMNGLLAQYQRLSGDNVTELGLSDLNASASLDDYKRRLIELVKANYDGKISIKGFDDATKELAFTVQKRGSKDIKSMTAAIRELDRQFVAVSGTIKRSETFLEASMRKLNEIKSYVSAMSVFSFAGRQLKQGLQYVKEIDLAMTELRKVTDETEESYDKFLKTASKSAAKVGSTMQKVISSTADWARIGYSLEDAATLAETTSILLNVSEFQSIDEATSALTSTLQAFSMTAEQSMKAVDVLNEVGNNFAVSSDGIATALKDSASSLVAANNTYEEAVAMIAAAM